MRVVDKELLAVVRRLPCLACLPVTTMSSDPHHLTSRGAGGGDTADNLIPLCRGHHTELHQIGIVTFFSRYKIVRSWLEAADRFDILMKETLRGSEEEHQIHPGEHGGRGLDTHRSVQFFERDGIISSED